MTFAEVYPFFKEGKFIQRLSNVNSLAVKSYQKDTIDTFGLYSISVIDILADDWMVTHLNFNVVINLLMRGKCKKIYRFGDRHKLENQISYLSDEKRLVSGLGTSSAKDYEFTEEDVWANDWCYTQ